MKGLIRFVVIMAAMLSALALATGDAGAQNALPNPSAAKTPPPAAVPPGGAPPDYVIGPEDMLQISVWKNELLSRLVPLRPGGKISLPVLHDVQAARLTAMQLRHKPAVPTAACMPNPHH